MALARYYINRQKIGLEVYIAGNTNKYVTVTGNPLTPGVDLEERGEQGYICFRMGFIGHAVTGPQVGELRPTLGAFGPSNQVLIWRKCFQREPAY